MADHIIGFAVKGISKSIAVSSELIAGKKGRNSAQARSQAPLPTSGDGYAEQDEDLTHSEWQLGSIDDDLHDDDADDPNENMPPTYVESTFQSPNEGTINPLPQAVLIPQRRPGDRRRGFVRAYAPILHDTKHIDQTVFLKFLDDYAMASRSSKIFDVVNLACFGLGMVPDAICIAVSSTVGTANMIAQQLQITYRSNTFLAATNEKLFKPRNCYAMIMTYKPEMADELILQADYTSPTSIALSKSLQQNSKAKELLRRLQKSAGTTTEAQIPECAELIHPNIDQALTSNSFTQSEQTSLTKNGVIINDYLDRRARTDFAAKYPLSKITATLPQDSQYVNRFADPNHPVNSGSIFGLLSGGTFDPIASGRVRRAEQHVKKHGQTPLTDQERHDAYMGRKVRGRVTGTPSKTLPLVGNVLKKDVLYLLIVELPSEEQIQSVGLRLQALQ